MFPLRFRTAVNFQLWNSTEIILFWSHQTEELHWRVTASRRLRVTALRGEMIGLRCSKGLGWSRKSKRSCCSDLGSSSLSTGRKQFDWPCPNALHEWILPMTLLVFLVLFSLQLTVWLIYSCTEPEVIMSAILKKMFDSFLSDSSCPCEYTAVSLLGPQSKGHQSVEPAKTTQKPPRLLGWFTSTPRCTDETTPATVLVPLNPCFSQSVWEGAHGREVS